MEDVKKFGDALLIIVELFYSVLICGIGTLFLQRKSMIQKDEYQAKY